MLNIVSYSLKVIGRGGWQWRGGAGVYGKPTAAPRPFSVSEGLRGDLASIFMDNPMPLFISGTVFFSLREKFVCFYMFSCYEVGLFFLREVLLYLWHQRSDSVFLL